MKRFLCLFMVVFLIPVCSFAESLFIDKHYSLFIDSTANIVGTGGSLFEFDSLCIDLYIMNDESTAFGTFSLTDSGVYLTSSCRFTIRTRGDGTVIFVQDNGEFFEVEYDENGTDLWIYYNGRNYRLRPVPAFSIYEDWK